MSNRVVLALVLLMCASFAAVLGVVWSAVSPSSGARSHPRSPRVVREPPPHRAEVGGVDGALATRRDKTLRSSSRFDIPLEAPPPAPQLMSPEELGSSTGAELEDRARAAAEQASRHLDRMEDRLKRQIRVLEESRNAMLDALASELRTMSPAEAAQTVALLDDETAAMALQRLARPFRDRVLQALPKAASRRLRNRLGSSSAN